MTFTEEELQEAIEKILQEVYYQLLTLIITQKKAWEAEAVDNWRKNNHD